MLRGNKVVACSALARSEGVRPRQRRREAESYCPSLVLVREDPVRDVRAFEPVVAAVGEFTPLVELTRPGVCSLPVRGPARYFGGEAALVSKIRKAVDQVSGVTCRIGIADTPFAARLAARNDLVVPCGTTEAWLAQLPIEVLGSPDLVDLLRRLGLERVGDFTALDEGVVGARFGSVGVDVYRKGRGCAVEALQLDDPLPDLSVSRELEDPVDQVETVAFIAAAAAEELAGRLAPHGLACTRLLVEASSDHGEALSRWWRADRPFTPRAMVDRVRWQLEGWMTAGVDAPTAGITLIRLTAGEVVPEEGRQLGIFGEPAEVRERVERHAARIQGLLGHDAVGTAVLVGGRGPAEQVRFVPFGEPRDEQSAAHHQPWPGRLPSPAPSLVFVHPEPVSVLGVDGRELGVDGRGQCTSVPVEVVMMGSASGSGSGSGSAPNPVSGSGSAPNPVSGSGQGRADGRLRHLRVVAWAGPWPAEERWWDVQASRRRARFQVELADGSAHVLVIERGRWALEATYD